MEHTQTKQCKRCGEMKPLTAFGPQGRNERCRDCLVAVRAWRLSDEYQEERKQYARKYYRKNKAALLAQNADYRATHRDHLIQLDREKYRKIRQAQIARGGVTPIRRIPIHEKFPPPDRFECAWCHEMKLPSGFYPDPTQPGKLMVQCRRCINAAKKREAVSYKGIESPEKAKWFGYRLRRQYGLSTKDFQSMLAQQNNRCAVCEREFLNQSRADSPTVDHCHTTEKIRSLLCDRCNKTLGSAGDDIALLRKMIAYLEQHGVTT